MRVSRIRDSRPVSVKWFKYTYLFHEIEEMVKDRRTSNKEISPKALNALVVNALPWDDTSTVWTTKWMRQHVITNIIIFSATITSHSGWQTVVINNIEKEEQ